MRFLKQIVTNPNSFILVFSGCNSPVFCFWRWMKNKWTKGFSSISSLKKNIEWINEYFVFCFSNLLNLNTIYLYYDLFKSTSTECFCAPRVCSWENSDSKLNCSNKMKNFLYLYFRFFLVMFCIHHLLKSLIAAVKSTAF